MRCQADKLYFALLSKMADLIPVEFQHEGKWTTIYTDKETATRLMTGKWSSPTVLSLINVRMDMDDLFKSPPCTKKKLWDQVAEKMGEQNFYVTGSACDKKWRNLLTTYRGIKDAHKQTASRTKWEFYELMNSYLGNKTSSELPAELLLSSSSASSPRPETPPSPSPTGIIEQSETSRKPQKTMKRKKEEPPEWFTNYVKDRKAVKLAQERRRAKARKEAKDNDEKKIKAIKDLTLAVLELVKKMDKGTSD